MSFAAKMRFFVKVAANQLLPHQCLLCRVFCFDRGICAACWDGACLSLSFMRAVLAGFVYNDFSRALILPSRYGGVLHRTQVLGRFVKRHFTAIDDTASLVIPIPLHRRRHLLRRYNQSDELTLWLAPSETFAPNILQRRHQNKSQAGLNRAQRKKNVAGMFSVPQKYRNTLSGKPVTLVDDVMVSGATLSAAARCLLAAGSGPVRGLVVARVL